MFLYCGKKENWSIHRKPTQAHANSTQQCPVQLTGSNLETCCEVTVLPINDYILVTIDWIGFIVQQSNKKTNYRCTQHLGALKEEKQTETDK